MAAARSADMLVAVVQVGIVRMAVHHRPVAVPVRMRLTWHDPGAVAVLVVCVMAVPVLMLHRLMFMRVLVPLGQVQP